MENHQETEVELVREVTHTEFSRLHGERNQWWRKKKRQKKKEGKTKKKECQRED